MTTGEVACVEPVGIVPKILPKIGPPSLELDTMLRPTGSVRPKRGLPVANRVKLAGRGASDAM